MTFLITLEALGPDGALEESETVVADLAALERIEKSATVFGRRLTLRLTFDPPVAPLEPQ